MDCRSTSPPTSDVFSDEMDSASVKEKALLNKLTPTHNNNNNFKAGYMPVQTTKPMFRGRKTFAFWTLVGLLFILAVGNLILTITILGVLKLSQGMQSIELLPEEGIIKFFGDIDLDHIYKRDGKLEGYEDEPMEITSDGGPIIVNLSSRTGRPTTKLKIDENEIVFKGINSFEVKNNEDESIFRVTEQIFPSLKNTKRLHTKQIHTNKIRSPSEEGLKIQGDIIHMKGAEGSKIDGSDVVFNADEDIYLKSFNGSIVLNAKEGTFIDVNRLPKVKLNNNNYLTAQFKVCVCVPGGKLFMVPVVNHNDKVFCDHINMSPQYNPCI